jgi:cell cycle checkpoint protein
MAEATGSSNQRRYHRADVGGFSITARGDFGQTEVSYNHPSMIKLRKKLDYPNDREVMDKFDCAEKVSFRYVSIRGGRVILILMIVITRLTLLS